LLTLLRLPQGNIRREGFARAILTKTITEALGHIALMHFMVKAHPYVIDIPQV
jgi:hypothetical protein